MAQREKETIGAEMKHLETLLRASKDRPGLADRVADIEARMEECRAELTALNVGN